jgi:hypothetical protein
MIIPKQLDVFRPVIPKTLGEMRRPASNYSQPIPVTESVPTETKKEKKRYIVSGLTPSNRIETTTITQPDETISIEELKKKNAELVSAELERQIQQKKEARDFYAELYNKTSDPDLADRYDEQRNEKNIEIQAFESARQYATGEYTPEAVIGYANYIASSQWDAAQQTLAQNRYERKQIESYISKGYNPVYSNPNDVNKVLLGFTKPGETITKETLMSFTPQQSISIYGRVDQNTNPNIKITEPVYQEKINPIAPTILNQTTSPQKVSVDNQKLIQFKQYTQAEDTKTFLSKPRISSPSVSNLPYQTRGTSYYDSKKGYYTPKTLATYQFYGMPQENVFNYVDKIIETPYTLLVENAKKNIKEKELNNLFIYTPTKSNIPRKETVSYAPTILSSSGNIEKERRLTEGFESLKLETKAKEKVDEIYNKYTTKIINQSKDKSLSESEFNKLVETNRKKAEAEAKIEINLLTKNYEGQYTIREEERAKKLAKDEFKNEFFERRINDVVRAGFYIVPYYGQALAYKDITKSVLNAPTIFSSFKSNPIESSIELGSSALIFGSTGYAVGKIKGKIIESKVNEAVKNADVVTKVKEGYLKESDLYWSKLSEEGKIEMTKLYNEGYSIRKSELTLEPKQGYEKYTPKVKGELIEAVSQEGEVVRSIPTGKITAKFKGKEVSTDIYGNVISQISKEGNVQSISDIVTKTTKKNIFGIKKQVGDTTINRYVSDTKLVKYKDAKELGDTREISTGTKTYLRSSKKYSNEKLLNLKPEETNLNGINFELIKKESKPLSGTASKEVQKLRRTEVKTIGDETGSSVITNKFYSIDKGKSITKNLFESKKESKPMKSFKEIKNTEPKRSLPKPESFKGNEEAQVLENVNYPSRYQGKQFTLNVSPVAEITSYNLTGLGKVFGGGYGVSGGIRGALSGVKAKNDYTRPKNPIIDIGFNREFNKDYIKPMDITDIKDINLTKPSDGIKPFDIFKGKENLSPKPNDRINVDTGVLNAFYPSQIDINITRTTQNTDQTGDFERPNPPKPNNPVSPLEFKYPEESTPRTPSDYQRKNKTINQGYDAYVYIDATKERKSRWEKINDKPLTKESALSLSARTVDQTISAKGKVSKSKPVIVNGKKTEVQATNTNDSYFEVNKQKFRTYQQRQGARKQLPNSFIERQKYRADKPMEVRTLKKARQFNLRSSFGF